MRTHAVMSSDALCSHFRPPITDNVMFPFPVNFRKLAVIQRHVQEFSLKLILVNKFKPLLVSSMDQFNIPTQMALFHIQRQADSADFATLTEVTKWTIFPPRNFRSVVKRSL